MLDYSPLWKIPYRLIQGIFLFFLLIQFYFLKQFYLHEDIVDETTFTQTIVVFSGGENRICTAVDLFKKELSDTLYISGLNPKSNKIQVLKATKCFDVDIEKVFVDFAKNTEENAEQTADWVIKNDIRSIRLVTTRDHMARSLLLLSKKIPTVMIIPHIVKKGSDEDTFPMFEFLKYEYQWFVRFLGG